LNAVGRLGSSRPCLVPIAGRELEQRLAHLRAARVVKADEQHIRHFKRPDPLRANPLPTAARICP
jgi:hypothetical protein